MGIDKTDVKQVVILFVEDDRDHAELVMSILRKHRRINKIHHVLNGEEALDYLHRRGDYSDQQKSPTPNLILLDLRLPKVDGLEVLRYVKSSAELSSIPVVILSTSNSDKDITAVYDYYANSYLVKPIDFDQFHQMLMDMSSYWLEWNKN